MQTIDSLGAGFSIASHDMDLRGFGNMVGDEQSGHIKEVGVELYQEMLESAINEMKNHDLGSRNLESRNLEAKNSQDFDRPEIKMNVPIFIPDEYIKDVSLRLSIYRRAAEINNFAELDDFKDELIDRFGKIPESVLNLLEIISLKIRCKDLGIKSLDVGSGGFNIKFYDSNELQNITTQKIMNFIAYYPRNAKIKPDNRLVFIKDLKSGQIMHETNDFLNNLAKFLKST